MPVATLPTYDDMWVAPQVVSALCTDGDFGDYTDAEPYDATKSYPVCSHVLDGSPDVPYGGYIWTAVGEVPVGVGPLTPSQVAWQRDDALLGPHLRLYTATTQATWLLDTLTQGRLHGAECWQEDYRAHTCTIRLRRDPVDAIASVERRRDCATDGALVSGWCWKSAQQISVCGDPSCMQSHCGNDVIRVVYRIAANLPPGTEALVAELACNYGKAAIGKPCKLPDRLTTITRQGVSWTVLDPQDFLDSLRMGMPRVDEWLMAVRAALGGTFIDPLTSHRLFATRLDCADVDWTP